MGDKPTLHPGEAIGPALIAVANDILAEARAALDDAGRSDAAAVHDYRKAMKRWRAFLRLIEPFLGVEGYQLRVEARELARELAGARDVQAALDALSDLEAADPGLSAASLATIRGRIEETGRAAETTTLTPEMRTRLRAALDGAVRTAASWRLGRVGFPDIAGELAFGYRRARRAIPTAWSEVEAKELHELRQRVVEHRYQMEIVEPVWPRMVKLWVNEAQRLRERLGSHQDLVVLAGLTAPQRPLARWRSGLVPLIDQRKARHAAAARRLAGRLFAETPKAFRRRLEALGDSRGDPDE
jgi:CHAD domain-containing protein